MMKIKLNQSMLGLFSAVARLVAAAVGPVVAVAHRAGEVGGAAEGRVGGRYHVRRRLVVAAVAVVAARVAVVAKLRRRVAVMGLRLGGVGGRRRGCPKWWPKSRLPL